MINAVRALLGTVQLRRTKATLTASGALAGVPPREEYTVFIPLTEAQRFWMYRMLTRLETVDLAAIFPRVKEEVRNGKVDDGRAEVLKHLENHAKGGPTTTKRAVLLFSRVGCALTRRITEWQKFSMLLMQLRRICDQCVPLCFVPLFPRADKARISPYMIGDAEPEQYEIGEHIVAASSKLMAIDKILADVLPKGERVLIFSVRLSASPLKYLQFTRICDSNGPSTRLCYVQRVFELLTFGLYSMLDLLEDYMVLRGIAFLRLDGSVSRARRSMVGCSFSLDAATVLIRTRLFVWFVLRRSRA